jgi:hypothetical protein
MKKYQQQKDQKGCGIACLANLLDKSYDSVKKDFEKKFYKIDRGVKMFDIVNYLRLCGLEYKSKFFNQNKKYEYNKKEGSKFSRILGSITLIAKSEKYKVGHYLLRINNGWVDPWINFVPLDKAKAGIRKKLPGNAWYVLYPLDKII